MLTDAQVRQRQDLEYIGVFQIQGDFQFPENRILAQSRHRFRLWLWPLTPFVVDQTVKENGQLSIAELLLRGIIILFQPITDLSPRDGMIGQRKQSHHLRVVEIKNIANTSNDVVIGHMNTKIDTGIASLYSPS